MKIGVLARVGAPLALLAVCALARPASAHVLIDFRVGTTREGPFLQQVSVAPGQHLFFRLATLNRFAVPVVAVCDIPLIGFKQREVLLPGRVNSIIVPARCLREGTFRVTAFVVFVNPFTGRVHEVSDSVIVICTMLKDVDPGKKDDLGGVGQQQGGQQQAGGDSGKKKDDTGGLGQQQGGQQQGGQQGGQQQAGGDSGKKKDDTGGLGQQQGGQQQAGGDSGKKKDDTGGLGQQQGGQQQGGQQGGQQQAGGDSGKKKDDTGGLGQQQGGQQQAGGDSGKKKDDTGGLGKDDAVFVF